LTIREHWNLIPVRSSAELGDAERLERVVAIARVKRLRLMSAENTCPKVISGWMRHSLI